MYSATITSFSNFSSGLIQKNTIHPVSDGKFFIFISNNETNLPDFIEEKHGFPISLDGKSGRVYTIHIPQELEIPDSRECVDSIHVEFGDTETKLLSIQEKSMPEYGVGQYVYASVYDMDVLSVIRHVRHATSSNEKTRYRVDYLGLGRSAWISQDNFRYIYQ